MKEDIKILIKGEEYTLKEAKELYNHPHKLFGAPVREFPIFELFEGYELDS